MTTFLWPNSLESVASRSRIAKMVLAAAVLSVLIVFTQVRASYAGQLTIHVQNSRGFSIAGAAINYGPDWVDPDPGNTATSGTTDVNGNWTGDPGSTFTVTYGSSAWAQFWNTPSVAGGGANGNTVVTLPSLSDLNSTYTPSSAAVTDDERYLVGRINQLRASSNLGVLQISSALNNAADSYATYLSANSVPVTGDGSSHYAYVTPSGRAFDAGWPSNLGVSENNGWGSSPTAEAMFASWENSSGHRANMMSVSWGSIGMARVGSYWVAMFGSTCTVVVCGMTGDYGDPTLDPGDGSGDGPGDGELLKPSLKVKRAKRVVKRGRKVKTSVTVKRGDGIVRASLRSGKTKAKIKTAVKISADGTKSYAFSATPKKTGRWTLTIRFSGRGNWDDKVITQRIRVVK